MKKILMLVLAVVLVIFSASVSFAHPPKDIQCIWSAKDSSLTVKVVHDVVDTAQHYILQLYVTSDDGTELFRKRYDRQTTTEFLLETIPLPDVKSGMNLVVGASCNIIGSKEVTFVIP